MIFYLFWHWNIHKTCDNIGFNRYHHSACLQLGEGDASFVLYIGYCEGIDIEHLKVLAFLNAGSSRFKVGFKSCFSIKRKPHQAVYVHLQKIRRLKNVCKKCRTQIPFFVHLYLFKVSLRNNTKIQKIDICPKKIQIEMRELIDFF